MQTNPTAPNGKLQIQEELVHILETVSAVANPIGIGYLIQLLQGRAPFGLKDETHAQLPGYGAMLDHHSERIRSLIQYLLDQHQLQIINLTYGSLAITPIGEAYLSDPQPVTLPYKALELDAHDQMLQSELRQLRKQWAEDVNQPAFRVFNNYVLNLLVREKPRNYQELKMIPGIGDYKANRYGPAILTAVAHVLEKQAEDRRLHLLKKAKSPRAQTIKALFEAGYSLERIAESQKSKPASISKVLRHLHKMGEIDLKPWIVQQVEAEAFAQATEFFEQQPQARLKKAYEALGLEYETLRMCRLYVSDMQQTQSELKVVS